MICKQASICIHFHLHVNYLSTLKKTSKSWANESMVYTHITTLLFAQTVTKRNSIQRMGGGASSVGCITSITTQLPPRRPSPGSRCRPPPLSAAGWPGSACLAPPCCAAGSACVCALLPLSPRTARWGQPSGVGGLIKKMRKRQVHSLETSKTVPAPTHPLAITGGSFASSEPLLLHL